MSTYGKTIKDLYSDICRINKAVEWLRDVGNAEEKKHYNAARGALFNAERHISELYSTLDPERENMELS